MKTDAIGGQLLSTGAGDFSNNIVEQRVPPIVGRAAITIGIGPHF